MKKKRNDSRVNFVIELFPCRLGHSFLGNKCTSSVHKWVEHTGNILLKDGLINAVYRFTRKTRRLKVIKFQLIF